MNNDSIMLRLKRKVKVSVKNFSSLFYIDKCNDDNDIILLASMGRSGSTLISNVIASSRFIRSYHEPFHPQKVPFIGNKLPHGTYFAPKATKEQEFSLFRKIFDGKVYNYWISSASSSFYFNKRLIKAIRINLLIPWIKEHFPEIKLIILMKNPFSVIDSWLNMKFGEGDAFKKLFFEQPDLQDLIPKHAVEMYLNATSTKEKLLFQWCIEYYIIFTSLKTEDYHLVVFERLLLNPQQEVHDLFEFIGRPQNEAWKKVIRKPSMTTSKISEVHTNPGKVSEKWKKNWKIEEIQMGKSILEAFNMNNLYENDLPTKASVISQFNPIT